MDVKMIMFSEDGSRKVFPVTQRTTTVGRMEDCGIRIPLPEISRKHLELTLEEDGVVLRDLGGANGTFLNNRRVTDEEDLEPGDQIIVGPVVFTVQIDGDPADDEMIKIRTKLKGRRGEAAAGADDADDPISALEALASSSEMTPLDDDED